MVHVLILPTYAEKSVIGKLSNKELEAAYKTGPKPSQYLANRQWFSNGKPLKSTLMGAPSGCVQSVHGCRTVATWWLKGWPFRWTSPWNGPSVSSLGTPNLAWDFGRLYLEYRGSTIRLLSVSILQSIRHWRVLCLTLT